MAYKEGPHHEGSPHPARFHSEQPGRAAELLRRHPAADRRGLRLRRRVRLRLQVRWQLPLRRWLRLTRA
ncbi:hypothetical protein ACIQGZ_26335 [Streptomyces sp. NPDC092296]|uniref:hypothetical protein n=1 Tax=Streptomyces sp. NPDC092296 TaxID=3366012 RepID=UPI003801B669